MLEGRSHAEQALFPFRLERLDSGPARLQAANQWLLLALHPLLHAFLLSLNSA